MDSIYKRTIILSVSRLLKFAVLLLSPIFLVRLLDQHSFGQYKEFVLYASLYANFFGMAISRSLLYFLPRSSDNKHHYVMNTLMITLVNWLIGACLVIIFRSFILSKTSYDFTSQLLMYSFFFINFEIIEAYLIANKKSIQVLYYTITCMCFRMFIIVLAAWYFKDVNKILVCMISVEVCKFLYCVSFVIKKGLWSFKFDGTILYEQLAFIVPLAMATTIFFLNQQLSRLFISTRLGVEALAVFAIGSTQIPLIGIVRGAVSDVIFPEMAERSAGDPLRGLTLWKRANVVYCFFVFPVFVVFFCHARLLIETLFTADYVAAVPVFRIYLLFFLRQCFEMGSPVRAMNKNKYFIAGNVYSLVLNIVLIVLLFKYLGFVGPAIAFVLSDFGLAAYMASRILKIYSVRVSKLFLWKKLFRIIIASVIASPIVLLGRVVNINEIVGAVIFSLLYLVTYYFILKRFKIEEVELIVGKTLAEFKRA